MKSWLVDIVQILLQICYTSQSVRNGCGQPPRRNNEELAFPSRKHSYSHGDEVVYNCQPGYIKLGQIRFQCNQGEWEQTMPHVECRNKPCGQPGDTPFGSFELFSGDEFVFGARVVYRCDEGYEMIGKTNYRECQVDGWSNDVPRCEIRRCPPVKAPEHGRLIMAGKQKEDPEFVYGQVVLFECLGSFKILGSEHITCTAEGEWSASVPTCSAMHCEAPILENGHVQPRKDQYLNAERVDFLCRPGFGIVGPPFALCSNAAWSSPPPICKVIECSMPILEHGTVWPRKKRYLHKEKVRYSCSRGYTKVGPNFSKCQDLGWSPMPPTCRSMHCGAPILENGHIRPRKDKYRNAESVHFVCHPGFIKVGPHFARCYNSAWSSPPPICKAMYCEAPILENGHLQPRKDQYQNAERVNFLCRPGFGIVGPPFALCFHAAWSSPPPMCKATHCESLFLDHGDIQPRKNHYLQGDVVQFSCHSEFTRVGPASSQCSHIGWSPSPPTCKAMHCEAPILENGHVQPRKDQYLNEESVHFLCLPGFGIVGSGFAQCYNAAWSSPPPICKAITCVRLLLEHGDIEPRKDKYLLQDVVRFSCQRGYTRDGPASTQCSYFGWSPPPPTCQVMIQCESLFLDHGDIQPRKDHYLQGDVIQFSCHSEFTRVGPASSQCYDFGWSPSPPTCKGQVNNCNTPLPNISNGSIIGDLYEDYEHEEQVEYKCNVKYALTGAKRITCIDGKWTSSPSCTVEEKTCGPPPSIPSGHVIGVVDREHYFHGETVRYRCEENFVITATNPAVCIHGEWELPICADDSTKCAHPSLPRNANIVSAIPLKSQYNTNDILSYSCDSRIYQTKCVNGEWLPQPACRELCPPPPQLLNAVDITEPRNYDSGERIHFQCQENFELQGPREILCKEDGKWQTPPRCVGTIS